MIECLDLATWAQANAEILDAPDPRPHPVPRLLHHQGLGLSRGDVARQPRARPVIRCYTIAEIGPDQRRQALFCARAIKFQVYQLSPARVDLPVTSLYRHGSLRMPCIR